MSIAYYLNNKRTYQSELRVTAKVTSHMRSRQGQLGPSYIFVLKYTGSVEI